MDEGRAALLAAYDAQLREENELQEAETVRRHGPLWWATYDDGTSGFCTYRDLGGARGSAVDALVQATIDFFRDQTAVGDFEWKLRGHDVPADLGARLESHGLVPDELEAVMVGDAAALAVDVPLPEGVLVRRVAGPDLLEDVRRALTAAADAFGAARGPAAERLAATLTERPDVVQLWVAEADGEVVCSGRLVRVSGTDFAGIWGGGTVPAWRGRGIYRALVSARARAALELGACYLHSDSSPMSRPILERMGMAAVTTTTPYLWTRP